MRQHSCIRAKFINIPKLRAVKECNIKIKLYEKRTDLR